MLVVILFLIVGAIIAYIAKLNLMPVTVNLKYYIFSNIPLFYVIVGSLLAGLVFSYLIYLIHVISTAFKLRGKDNELKKEKSEVLELTKRVHQLELENEKLEKETGNRPEDPHAL